MLRVSVPPSEIHSTSFITMAPSQIQLDKYGKQTFHLMSTETMRRIREGEGGVGVGGETGE